MSIAAPRPLSSLLSKFPIRTLANETDALREKEVLVKCRTMAGDDHLIAIADWQTSGTIAMFAAHICNVYHEQIHLSIDCETLDYNKPMTEVAKLLEKTGGVVQILVKDPPSIIINWYHPPPILIPRRIYNTGIDTSEGW